MTKRSTAQGSQPASNVQALDPIWAQIRQEAADAMRAHLSKMKKQAAAVGLTEADVMRLFHDE